MPEPSHHPTGTRQVLPGGETIEIDGSTVADPDPDTGKPAPAAVLRLPAWRLRELAVALDAWTATLALVSGAMHLPTERALSAALTGAAEVLTNPH